MKIVIDRPPMWDEIDAAFKVEGKPVIFAWGDKIYNPEGGEITPELVAHEEVHGERQGADVRGWWERYIKDPHFRLAEEVPAHRAEYRHFCTRSIDRNARALYAHAVALRLCSPLYGRMVSLKEAIALVMKP
jgi:hypothetical protein